MQSLVAERQVGRMVEPQRRGRVQARARLYDIFETEMRLLEGPAKVDASSRSRCAGSGNSISQLDPYPAPDQRAKPLCARIVPEDVGCGDLSDSVDSGISNLRVSNTG
jgi:hypothetical protein